MQINFNRRLPVDINQVVGFLEPRILTNRGGTEASWATAIHGPDDLRAVRHLLRDMGIEGPTTTESVQALLLQSGVRDIAFGTGAGLVSKKRVDGMTSDVLEVLRQAGITPNDAVAGELKEAIVHGLKSRAGNLPIKFGGMLPGKLSERDELLKVMGFHPSQLSDSDYRGAFRNQETNFRCASKTAVMQLYPAVEALIAMGRPLSRVFAGAPNRLGMVEGHAFMGLDVLQKMFSHAFDGETCLAPELFSSLQVASGSLFKNLVMAPKFDFAHAGGTKENPEGIEKIVPADLGQHRIGNTAGPCISVDGACASGLFSFAVAAMLLETGRADAVMAMVSDAALGPSAAPAAIPGFGVEAPVTIRKLVKKEIARGRMEPLYRGESHDARWYGLSPSHRWTLMNQACCPGTKYAAGLVFAEGSGAVMMEHGAQFLEQGHWPTALLAGCSVGSGESGQGDMVGMSQAGITVAGQALDDALTKHGVVPNVTYLHGTSTRLFNYAEIDILHKVMQARNISHMKLAAIQGHFGHTMGGAGFISAALAMLSLKHQHTPLMVNFESDALDPRYAERIPGALKDMSFESGTYQGDIPAVLVQAFGFGDRGGAAVLKHVPQDKDAAVDLWRDYHATEEQIARWKDRVDETAAFRQEHLEQGLLRGRTTHRDIAELMGWE